MPCPYIEYAPSMLQCHRYTEAPANGAQLSALSVTVNSTVVGTPSATPVAVPKLDRMSRRTIPLSVSTSGPLEPSPGNGPAVSSGIVTHDALVVAAPSV